MDIEKSAFSNARCYKANQREDQNQEIAKGKA